jgi:hypothetical protein
LLLCRASQPPDIRGESGSVAILADAEDLTSNCARGSLGGNETEAAYA